jgi:hypothetical protein
VRSTAIEQIPRRERREIAHYRGLLLNAGGPTRRTTNCTRRPPQREQASRAAQSGTARQAHPEIRHHTPVSLAGDAVIQAFPCRR